MRDERELVMNDMYLFEIQSDYPGRNIYIQNLGLESEVFTPEALREYFEEKVGKDERVMAKTTKKKCHYTIRAVSVLDALDLFFDKHSKILTEVGLEFKESIGLED